MGEITETTQLAGDTKQEKRVCVRTHAKVSLQRGGRAFKLASLTVEVLRLVVQVFYLVPAVQHAPNVVLHHASDLIHLTTDLGKLVDVLQVVVPDKAATWRI